MSATAPKKSDVKRQVVPFQNAFNHIAPRDMQNMLETLCDMGCLNDVGREFNTAFWWLFIRSPKNKDVTT